MQFIIPQQRNQPKCRNLRSTGTPQLLCPSLHHLTLPEGLGSWARAPDGEPLPSLKWAHAGLWGNSQGVAQGTEHHPPIPQQTGSHDLVHCPQVADNLCPLIMKKFLMLSISWYLIRVFLENYILMVTEPHTYLLPQNNSENKPTPPRLN